VQPSSGQTVEGTVGIATWTDNSVNWVNWYVDGHYLASSPGSAASAWEYYWDSTAVPNGSHVLSVTGYGNNGQWIAQPSMTVWVENGSGNNRVTTSSGSVSISEPSAGATVSGTVPFSAQATGSVSWINYYVDGNYVWSSPGYTYRWNASGSGSHTLSVTGYDTNGSQVGQASIQVTVGGSSSSSSSGSGPSYFSLQPVGASLPSADQCAQWVRSRDNTELQPSNATANQTTPTWSQLQSFHSNPTYINDLPLSDWAGIDGQFTGTTKQIIRWAACKWGLDENAMMAESWEETTPPNAAWAQSQVGDWRTDITQCQAGNWNGWTGSGCWQSYGIFQAKPLTWNIWPEIRDSTAFSADLRSGYMRACINGDINGLHNGYPNGDSNYRFWGCMGEWFSGYWYDSGATYYNGLVQNYINLLPWNNY
jgi:hypothetical protein